MKTQEEITKQSKELNKMGNAEKVRWFQAKPDPKGEWLTWSDVPIDDVERMITYCTNCRIDFSIDFKHKED